MVHLCKFGENPSIHPLIQKISYIQDFHLDNRVKVTKKKSSQIVLKVYLCWIGDNQAKGSRDVSNFSEIFTYLSPPVTLKMKSSLKTNQLLSLSKWYIYVSLEKVHPLVQEISYIQDYDLENRVKITQNFTCHMKNIYLERKTLIHKQKYTSLALPRFFALWGMEFV